MTKPHEALNQYQISEYFRANVGILIISKEGLVLAAEQSERPGSWQLPQGGIDQGEEEEQAVFREMREELGFNEQDIKNLLQPLGTHSVWFAYQIPKANWSGKNGRGQAQRFFAYRFLGQDNQLDEKFGASEEFRAWKWVPISELIDEAWEIRRPVYTALAQAFSKYLDGTVESIIRFPAGKPQYLEGPDSGRMCGDGRLETLDQVPKSPRLRAKFVKFKNGGHTKWHCHQVGEQVLYVTKGKGFVQQDGQPRIQLQKGDRVYIPEGIWHRHGALEGKKGKFVHLAITTGKTKYRKNNPCG